MRQGRQFHLLRGGGSIGRIHPRCAQGRRVRRRRLCICNGSRVRIRVRVEFLKPLVVLKYLYIELDLLSDQQHGLLKGFLKPLVVQSSSTFLNSSPSGSGEGERRSAERERLLKG